MRTILRTSIPCLSGVRKMIAWGFYHGIVLIEVIMNPMYMQLTSRIQAFTLFEVLIAWSLFTVVVIGVAYAQVRALNSLRDAYIKEVAFIQLLNIKDIFRSTQDPVLREQAYNVWHKQNIELLIHPTDRVRCHTASSCCVDLYGARYSLSTCFST